jgi:hypothetical protein
MGPRCLFAGPPREQTASPGYQHPDGGRWPPGGEASFFSFAGAVVDGFGVSRDIFRELKKYMVSILRQETEVANNWDVELNVNFNYDGTTPGKVPSGAFVN